MAAQLTTLAKELRADAHAAQQPCSSRTFSLQEAAEQLGFAEGQTGSAGYQRVYKMVARGELKAVRMGRHLRVSANELRRFLT